MLQQSLKTTLALSLLLTSYSSLPPVNQLIKLTVPSPSFLSLKFEPPNDGAPGRREDAGSRPNCPQVQKPFVAIIPVTNLGVTVSAHPTFWLYIPYPSAGVEFILKDEQNQEIVYQTVFHTKKGPGIVSFRPPANAHLLIIGKKYRWQFDLFCQPTHQYDYLSVNGVILRQPLTPSLSEQLEKATPLERIQLYAESGIWYETITELAQLNHSKDQWKALLQHPLVRLEKFVSEPFID